MVVPALFRSGNIPADDRMVAVQLVFIAVIKLNAAGGQHGNFAVLNVHNILCVGYYRRNVRGNVISVVRQPQYQRAEFAHGYQRIGVIGADNTQRI